MSSENTKLWDILGRTDPKHTSPFKRGGGFKGTAIKPMWSYRRMTEHFGPCGKGWGVGEPQFQIVQGVNQEVMVYCTASIWYEDGSGISRTVYGVGGDKIVTHIRATEANTQYNRPARPERWENDDEAFKKAFTDAVTNALKLIGVGADVHMGMFDDSKYVNTMRKEFEEEPTLPAADGALVPPPRRKSGLPATGWKEDGTRTSYSLRQDKDWPQFERELMECTSIAEVQKFALSWSALAEKKAWNNEYRQQAKDAINDRREQLLNGVIHPDPKVAAAIEEERRMMANSPIMAG